MRIGPSQTVGPAPRGGSPPVMQGVGQASVAMAGPSGAGIQPAAAAGGASPAAVPKQGHQRPITDFVGPAGRSRPQGAADVSAELGGSVGAGGDASLAAAPAATRGGVTVMAGTGQRAGECSMAAKGAPKGLAKGFLGPAKGAARGAAPGAGKGPAKAAAPCAAVGAASGAAEGGGHRGGGGCCAAACGAGGVPQAPRASHSRKQLHGGASPPVASGLFGAHGRL